LPERSFYLQSFQLPVCARCLGLYGGGALGSVAAAVTMAPLGRHRALTLVAALPTAATFVLEWGAGWRISNEVRAAAALPLGLMVAFVVVSATATLHYDGCTPARPIAPAKPPAPNI
jgi:uncharacterized membrane protein